jgi:hypothetical protein
MNITRCVFDDRVLFLKNLKKLQRQGNVTFWAEPALGPGGGGVLTLAGLVSASGSESKGSAL